MKVKELNDTIKCIDDEIENLLDQVQELRNERRYYNGFERCEFCLEWFRSTTLSKHPNTGEMVCIHCETK